MRSLRIPLVLTVGVCQYNNNRIRPFRQVKKTMEIKRLRYVQRYYEVMAPIPQIFLSLFGEVEGEANQFTRLIEK